MTKQEVLEKLKVDMELRGMSVGAIHNYMNPVRIYQDYFDKAADQMRSRKCENFRT